MPTNDKDLVSLFLRNKPAFILMKIYSQVIYIRLFILPV